MKKEKDLRNKIIVEIDNELHKKPFDVQSYKKLVEMVGFADSSHIETRADQTVENVNLKLKILQSIN